MPISFPETYKMNGVVCEILNEIFSDFREEVESGKRLCDLKTLRFDRGHLPDYGSKLVEQLYLLRYLHVYTYEYYDIYKRIFSQRFLKHNFADVLSIGCGSGADYLGLHFACTENGKSSFRYRGIDSVDWPYKKIFRDENAGFDVCDASMFKNFSDRYNVIIFPKSIGEFGRTAFRGMLTAFRNTEFRQNRIILAASLRDTYIDDDIGRMEQIVNTVARANNYLVKDGINEIYSYKDGWLGNTFKGFDYPDEINDYLDKLHTQCLNFNKNNKACAETCKEILDKHPIFVGQYLKNQIIRLER